MIANAALRSKPRTYYGRRLLALGPLTGSEFREITGWSPGTSAKTLDRMRVVGHVLRGGDGLWRLTPKGRAA